jgi:hypothetical protein
MTDSKPGYGGEATTLKLTDDQVRAIEVATGAHVTNMEIQAVAHSVEDGRAGSFGERAPVTIVPW